MPKTDDYLPELNELLDTLKRIDLKLANTVPYLLDFQALCDQIKGPRKPLAECPHILVHLNQTIQLPDIRREYRATGVTRVWLDNEQYLDCTDETLGEYLELAFRDLGERLLVLTPAEIQQTIQVPSDSNTTIRIIGERILLQMRERDLVNARAEAQTRLDDIRQEMELS